MTDDRDLVLAIDQGSSATKALLVDSHGRIIARTSVAITEHRPHPGWVELDPEEIRRSIGAAAAALLADVPPERLAGIAIANQRETTLVWERHTGKPLHQAISWQDCRTAAFCDRLRASGHAPLIRRLSGLPLDPMFSAAKARYLLDAVDPDRARARRGDIMVGTIDAWLMATFGTSVIEAGNASRTQLLRVADVCWDDTLLSLFGIPSACLPEIVASTGPFPKVRGLAPVPDGTPVVAVLGDSHAAIFAHGIFEPGRIKATYGTGSSVAALVDAPPSSESGLCASIAWQMKRPAFMAEGNIRSSGATLAWLSRMLDVSVDQLLTLAACASASAPILVPGFDGLGAPWWDAHAVGILSGLRLDTTRAELALAAVRSIPLQINDVIERLRAVGPPIDDINVDGGPTRSDLLMQLQADISALPVLRPEAAELSALGVATLGGVSLGWWDLDMLNRLQAERRRFAPDAARGDRDDLLARWSDALARARLASSHHSGVEAA